VIRDWIDWIGGWPYEFAPAKQVMDFYGNRGLEMLMCVNHPAGRAGNNELCLRDPGTGRRSGSRQQLFFWLNSSVKCTCEVRG